MLNLIKSYWVLDSATNETIAITPHEFIALLIADNYGKGCVVRHEQEEIKRV